MKPAGVYRIPRALAARIYEEKAMGSSYFRLGRWLYYYRIHLDDDIGIMFLFFRKDGSNRDPGRPPEFIGAFTRDELKGE